MDMSKDNTISDAKPAPKRRFGVFRSFRKSKDGSAAIEFAFLAFPFFILVFATIEAVIAFAGEQLLAHGVDTLARKIRTGQITYNMGRATDMSETEFRDALCAEISVLITCPPPGAPEQKLYIDVREMATFADIPKGIPRLGNSTYGDLDTTGFDYDPGEKSTINMVRAYYRWTIMTDLIRPFITNARPDGVSVPTDFIMVATAAFQNEAYP